MFVDLGFDNLYKRVRARLRGVDTPNASPENGNPSEDALKVQSYVQEKISSRPVYIDVHKVTKRGWWVVTLYVDLGEHDQLYSINDLLKKQGHVYAS